MIKAIIVNILYAVTILGLAGCFSVKSTENFNYHKVDPEKYRQLMVETENKILIDVRTTAEYDKGHIPGAVNYSYLSSGFKNRVDSISRTTTVFLYCQTCHRSPLAARKMKKMGFKNVVDLKGGYKEWPVQ